MKLVKLQGQKFIFHLDKREKRLFFELLSLYPLLPSSYHRLSRHTDPDELEADQKLLDEALAQQKKENKEKVRALIQDPQRFQEQESGYHFSLTAPEIEWLLQVINDVRVGSWITLGSPEQITPQSFELTEENARYFLAMEISSYFQMILLEAFDAPDSE